MKKKEELVSTFTEKGRKREKGGGLVRRVAVAHLGRVPASIGKPTFSREEGRKGAQVSVETNDLIFFEGKDGVYPKGKKRDKPTNYMGKGKRKGTAGVHPIKASLNWTGERSGRQMKKGGPSLIQNNSAIHNTTILREEKEGKRSIGKGSGLSNP